MEVDRLNFSKICILWVDVKIQIYFIKCRFAENKKIYHGNTLIAVIHLFHKILNKYIFKKKNSFHFYAFLNCNSNTRLTSAILTILTERWSSTLCLKYIQLKNIYLQINLSHKGSCLFFFIYIIIFIHFLLIKLCFNI